MGHMTRGEKEREGREKAMEASHLTRAPASCSGRTIVCSMTCESASGDGQQAACIWAAAARCSHSGWHGGCSCQVRTRVGTPTAHRPRLSSRATEHTAERGDCHMTFRSGNYGVETTPAIEWAFVATPDQPPADGWPIEHRILEAELARLKGEP